MSASVNKGDAAHVVDAALVRIARGGGASLLGSALSAILSFLTVFIVARSYDIGSAGLFFASTSLFMIAFTAAQVGVDQGFVRFIAHHEARNERWATRHILRIGYMPVILVGTGMAVAAVAGSHFIAAAIGAARQDDAVAVFQVLALAVPVAATYEVTLAATRGFGSMRFTVLIERICRPIVQTTLVVVCAALHGSVTLLAVVWAAPYAIGLALAAFSLRRLAILPTQADPTIHDVDTIGREFWHFSRAQAVARLAQVALLRADVVIVAVLLGPASAAVYTAATRFVAVGQVAVQAVQQVVQPRLATLLALHEDAATRIVLQRVTVWFVVFTWPLYLTLALNSQLLLRLLGDEYAEGWLSLSILSIALLLANVAGPVDVLLLMSGRSALSCLNIVLALAIDVVLCFALLPVLGISGAAAAWAVAIVSRNVIASFQVKYQLNMQVVSRSLVVVCIAALLSFGVVPGLIHLVLGQWLAALLGTSVAVVLYGACLWRLRIDLDVRSLRSATRNLPSRAGVPT